MAASKASSSSSIPEDNVAYPLKLGHSLKTERADYFTLKYQFKPDKLDQTRPGILSFNNDDQAYADFHYSDETYGKRFVGRVASDKGNEDRPKEWAIIFRQGQWRLERVRESIMNLKMERENVSMEEVDVESEEEEEVVGDTARPVIGTKMAGKGLVAMKGNVELTGRRVVRRRGRESQDSEEDSEDDDSDSDDSDDSDDTGSYTTSSSVE